MATHRAGFGDGIEESTPAVAYNPHAGEPTEKEREAGFGHSSSISKNSSGSESPNKEINEKSGDYVSGAVPAYDEEEGNHSGKLRVENAEQLVTSILSVDDDPTLNAWTFRMWFLGLGLSLFGSVLATIYYFKPQTVFVSVIFLAVVSYVLGELMEKIIPKSGFIGRWFNPHKFNHKEHAAIVIMSSSAATCALGTEVLAVQRLYYSTSPNAGASIFLLFSSQLLGYGIAGLMRKTLVYPTKMLYPINLPLNTLLETLHRDKTETARRLKLFYIMFCVLFVWEVFPEYIMPLMTGISIFCLAKRDSLVFTNLFGGANGNEGLGLLSWCMDWQYIAGTQSPLWFPLQTLVNNLVGYLLCICVFMGVYYMNVWNAQDFPFLSQLLFSNTSNSTVFAQYNQTAVLDSNNVLNEAALEQLGVPYFASTYATYILSTNLAITATFTHMFLWNYNDISTAWGFASYSNIKSIFRPSSWNYRFWKSGSDVGTAEEDGINDPHYALMRVYKDAPNWWYGLVLIFSIIVGLICLYSADSTLPWWAFLIACALSSICILFFGAQYAITGFQFIIQPIIQMIGGYLHPGYPVANMYFTLFGYNSVVQGQLLLKDLKLAQYAKLPPRVTFTVQLVGTIIGAIFNYVMMVTIVTNQREILLSIEGTNIWSGQNVQQYNSQAIAWGALASHMFSVGARYQWVTLAFLVGFVIPLPFYFLHRLFPKAGFWYWNTAIITYYIGWLCVGINSSIMSYFAVGFLSQFYMRKYHPEWFVKYNYILSAAMDGGTQVLVFILTFAVQGGSGAAVIFPTYWGQNGGNGNGLNYDYCMFNPANG
ncbi:hypothetical protein MMC19_005893 [Ptychographa xylographoides]|nr:hypothetical protein [Ptychographa xylographoides]